MTNIEYDKHIIRFMVELYCRRHLGQENPSEEWQRLIGYAQRHLDSCPYGEAKPACKRCKTHCYNPRMAGMMRRVMRWTGPRMPFLAPKATWCHVWQLLRR